MFEIFFIKGCRFQSTLPRGERRLLKLFLYLRFCFNPRSRAGSDVSPVRLFCLAPVSIHAPARGATVSPIHSVPTFCCFNPRSRAGSDAIRRDRPIQISRFNPRSRAGSDVSLTSMRTTYTLFQSTLPRGERHIPVPISIKPVAVSIHAPARGATWVVSPFARFVRVSIHAPARGATWAYWQALSALRVSIHAPARGATRPRRRGCQSICRFNPRSRAGSD